MIGQTKEGWTIITDDHSQWSHSDLVRKHGTIEIELAELDTQAFIRPYLIPGSAAIDVGAHLGTISVPIARALGPDGLLLAFEPDPDLYQCLCANLERAAKDGPLATTKLYQKAVSDRKGVHHFYRNKDNWGAGHLDFGHLSGTDTVQVDMLDAYRRQLDNRKLSFIKIDCEGAEIDTLRGARHLILIHRPVLFIESSQHALASRGITLGELEAEIADLDYDITYYPKHWKVPHDLLAIPRAPSALT